MRRYQNSRRRGLGLTVDDPSIPIEQCQSATTQSAIVGGIGGALVGLLVGGLVGVWVGRG